MKPIAFYPDLARELGSINAAVYYQQLFYWSDKGKRKDGFIYKTAKEMEEETTLTEKQQRNVRSMLVKKGWLKAKKIMANGSMTWHYKPIVDVQVVIQEPTGERPVATGERPVRTSKKASSITENTTENTQSVISISKDIDITDKPAKNLSPKTKNKEKKIITYMIDYFKKELDLPVLDKSVKQNRKYAQLWINKFGDDFEQFAMAVKAVKANTFWKRKVTSLETLYYRTVEIMNDLRDDSNTVEKL